MVSVYNVARLSGKLEYVEDYPDTTTAVRDMRQMWNETVDPQTFVVCWEDALGAKVLATMMRADCDPELCVTTYSDGRSETHRCHYVVDEAGEFDYCEVTELLGRRTTPMAIVADGEVAVIGHGGEPWTVEEILAREG